MIIASRSGLAKDARIHVGAGTIDSDYRGTIKVLLMNFGEKDFEVTKGMGISNMMILPTYELSFIEMTVQIEIDNII